LHEFLSENQEALEPEIIQLLVHAMDDAWRRVRAKSAEENQPVAARMALASIIVGIARAGERDHHRLVDRALTRFRL
jgi:hypothetical protein